MSKDFPTVFPSNNSFFISELRVLGWLFLPVRYMLGRNTDGLSVAPVVQASCLPPHPPRGPAKLGVYLDAQPWRRPHPFANRGFIPRTPSRNTGRPGHCCTRTISPAIHSRDHPFGPARSAVRSALGRDDDAAA